ncbi:hypothetical protein [Parapedobacter lycopersici]|uniref:hypothetical protein n=1 Tax=Parapedobacter lycopersici TaxID=1864939 RepID=UPI00214D2AED|nr:hypothetical protein [Parapedobacter lycopersici]
MPNKPNPVRKPPRRKNDELLKGAFEEHFVDFLRFLYHNADELFDFGRDLVFMDKELHAIIPSRERSRDKRVADLLVKIYLKSGEEKYILLNTEIEAGSRETFARRIYQYNYRIWDRYAIPVATIAVFIGDRNQRRPGEYWSQVLDTTVSFRYRTYHIFDHPEDELMAMDNPFALVVLACQKALLEGKVSDEVLGRERLMIAKALLAHDYHHDRILSFLVFLKNFVFVGSAEINRNFIGQAAFYRPMRDRKACLVGQTFLSLINKWKN